MKEKKEEHVSTCKLRHSLYFSPSDNFLIRLVNRTKIYSPSPKPSNSIFFSSWTCSQSSRLRSDLQTHQLRPPVCISNTTRAMSLLRLMRSAHLARPARTAYTKHLLLSSTVPATQLAAHKFPIRCLAAEPGFPDRDNVSGRVLEVVRKFEKVCMNSGHPQIPTTGSASSSRLFIPAPNPMKQTPFDYDL